MALRRTATSAILLAIAVGFAAGVAVDRFALPTTTDRDGAMPAAPLPMATCDGLPLAARPAKQRSTIVDSSGAAAPVAPTTPSPDGARASEPPTSVAEAVQTLDRALSRVGIGEPGERRDDGDRAAAFLEGRDDRALGLLVARWLAAHERTAEAVRRVLAQMGRRTPTLIEIGWLSEVDPRAGVAAARVLVERRPGSPQALETLAASLANAGDTAAAFDAYTAALRAGLPANNGASELSRLDPSRAISVLVELYGDRDVGAGARALIEAYLRIGRVADAGRELVRLLPSQDGQNGLLESAAILEPEATARALAPQMDDFDSAAATDRDALLAYRVALRRAGHCAEALPVLRAVVEKRRDTSALGEMLRCDPISTRSYVEAHLPPETNDDALELVRLLGALGRRDEATGLFARRTAERDVQPNEWVAFVYAAPDRAITALRHGLAEARRSRPGDVGEWLVSLAHALEAAGRIADAKAAWAEIQDHDLDLELLVEKAALK
jgi:hypothetical protein